MKKRTLTRALTAVVSASMVLATPLTAFAEAPTTTAGTGNILAYSVEEYVVPTSISIALNPQGYEIQLRDGEEDTDKTDAQIVSLNYGVANLSTADKVINLNIAVTGGDEVTFVDSADAISTTEAAPEIYLAIAGSTGDVTNADGDPFAVDEKDGANEHNVDAAGLTDIVMAVSTEDVAVFDETAVAEKSFELGAATYDVQDDQTVDFDDTQTTLAGKMEITAVGDVKGFTLTGAMNTKQDWTELTAKALTFTPTYECIDPDDVVIPPTEVTATYDSTNTRWAVALPEGVTITDISEVRNAKANGNAMATIGKNAAGTEIRFVRSDVKNAIGETPWQTTTDIELTFTINGVNYKATTTK